MTYDMRGLVDRLNRLAHEYYDLDAPTVSDKEYDKLYDELVRLEKSSGVVLPDSPTHRVGGQPLDRFEPHTHLKKLLSMDKAQSLAEIGEWYQRAEKLRSDGIASGLKLPPLSFVVEHKFDGLTLCLTYKNGVLVQAATRGNGVTGEGILAQAKTVRSIPLTIPYMGTIEVHGECYMRLSVLEKYNKTASEPLKNARNAAAGALRNLDPQVTASRHLDAIFYDVNYIEGKEFADQAEMLAFLKENGFSVSATELRCRSLQEIKSAIDQIEETRGELDYLIDGAVVKISDYATRAYMGSTEKFPRWAVAYKFEAEEVTTKLKKVTWEVGRTGKLTPLAHVEPVELAGATIQRATLNNYSDILRKRLKLNARVWLRRSNEVIPEITGRVDDYYPDETEIEKPETCPCCGHALEEKGAFIYCPNSRNCTDQIVMRLSHFASRDAMDIEAFSEKTARQFCDEFDIKDCDELYDLQYDKLVALDRFGEKKAQKLLEELDKSKSVRLDRFIYALGIPNVGTKTARDLAEAFGDIEKLKSATAEELTAIGDIGDIVADSILDYFASDTGRGLADRLLAKGVQPVWENERLGSSLNGMTVVVTGTLVNYSRQQAEELIRQNGGKASSSVSAKTSLVLAGENAGSKLDKAQKLGIRIVNEEEFEKIIAKS